MNKKANIVSKISLLLKSDLYYISVKNFPMFISEILSLEKCKRQVEILGLCLPDIADRDKITIYDLCELFNVQIATIERDLNELRSRGIPIHSQAKEGIIISGNVPTERLKNELLRYISIHYAHHFDELINIENCNEMQYELLTLFVTLQNCIDRKQAINITLNKAHNKGPCLPLKVIRKNKQWYLVYELWKELKISLLTDISSVQECWFDLDEYPSSKDVDEFINSHFNIKSEYNYEIKLSFSKTDHGKFPTQITNTKIVKTNDDGSRIIMADCSNLDEIVPWLIANAGGVVVLEPPELRKKIMQIAKIIIDDYEKWNGVLFSKVPIQVQEIPEEERYSIDFYTPDSLSFKEYQVDLNLTGLIG